MKATPDSSLGNLSEGQRQHALERFRIIRPFLDAEVSLTAIAEKHGVPVRTARRWVKHYREQGLTGLVRKGREDADALAHPLREIIEGLALQKPKPTAATIHRKAVAAAKELDIKPPSYSLVYKFVRQIEPALVTLAHEGAKGYSNSFDLVHRREAERPNAIWQADHTELDILVHDEKGDARKPWLTVVLDDYSRAVAG